MKEVFDSNGVLRERWDNTITPRIYTAWDENGTQTIQREFTEEENTTTDAIETHDALVAASIAQAEESQAIIAAIAATAVPPSSGGVWAQPLGAHDAYEKDATVTHNGKEWISLTAYNVWEPGVANWREIVAEGYPAWVQPTGAHDAYNVGDRVTHSGQDWESNTPANVWEPGVFGWVVIP